jgi:uncharacterized membrane protein HdeD (DUF308 family)
MSSTEATAKMHLFLTRGLVAIAWAVVFAAAAPDSGTAVPAGVGVLLVIYPLIDVVACLIDARGQAGSSRQVLLANAAVSALAAIALGVAATGTIADVLAAFGAWAFLAGGAQLIVVLRRRALLGNQWPLLLSGSFSLVAGVVYLIMSGASDPKLLPLVFYAATGGVEFAIQAWLLARRRDRLVTRPA